MGKSSTIVCPTQFLAVPAQVLNLVLPTPFHLVQGDHVSNCHCTIHAGCSDRLKAFWPGAVCKNTPLPFFYFNKEQTKHLQITVKEPLTIRH